MSRSFQILGAATRFDYEEKKSQFLCFLYPVNSKEEASQYLLALKQQYPDARHHCSAYVIGDPEQASAAGYNDDGEPSGTAGKPMLNVLMQRKVGNVTAIVVRYFGGIKLGAGGLTRAYGQAVSGAVDLAELCQVEPMTEARILCDFAMEEKIRALLARHQIDQVAVVYSHEVQLRFSCPSRCFADLREQVRDQSAGRAKLLDD